jgi:FMN phosphatase YigB (HAD superfamily)
MSTKAFVFDIGGTLTNEEHRDEWTDEKVDADPSGYDKVVKGDTPKPGVEALLRGIAKDYDIVLLSCRTAKARKAQEEWLHNEKLPYAELIMRKHGDAREDDVVKEDLYNSKIKGKYKVIGVFDNKKKNSKLFKRLGLESYQLRDEEE